jgi:hypothetical protein
MCMDGVGVRREGVRREATRQVPVCQHTSAYVSIRQHTSAYLLGEKRRGRQLFDRFADAAGSC